MIRPLAKITEPFNANNVQHDFISNNGNPSSIRRLGRGTNDDTPTTLARPSQRARHAPYPLLGLLLALLLGGTSAEEYSQTWARTSTQINDQPPQIQEIFREAKQEFLGCVFSDSVCNSNEICFDDLVFGQCVSEDEATPARDESLERFPSLTDDEKALIAFELDDLDQKGFDWDDLYTQCILQNLHSFVQYNTEFEEAECALFLPTTPLDYTPDDYLEEDDDNDDEEPILDEESDGSDMAETIPEEYLEVLQALGRESDRRVVPKKIPRDPLWPNSQDGNAFMTIKQGGSDDQGDGNGDIVVQGDDNEMIDYLNSLAQESREDLDDTYETPNHDLLDMENFLRFQSSLSDTPEDELYDEPETLETLNQLPRDTVDQVGKRNGPLQEPRNLLDRPLQYEPEFGAPLNANNFDDQLDDTPEGSYNLDYPTEDEGEAPLSPLDYGPLDPYDYPAYRGPYEGDFKPRSGGSVLRLPGGGLESSIFNRNERLDVKKPGPFYKNSANNFFLDKLLRSDSEEERNDTQTTADVGQVEYEMPLLAPIKDKRDLPLESDVAERDLEPRFVHISLGKRFETYQQGSNFVRYLAHEFGIPEEALDDQVIEDHHVQFQVNPNPQNIDAIHMAKRLDGDSLLKNKIEDQVGIQIGKAAAGNRDDVGSVFYPGGSNFNLLILVVLAVSTLASLLVIGVISLLVRRRARVQKIRSQDHQEEEKGKAQQEYQQLCRDWSRTSRKSEAKPVNVPTTAVKKQLQNRESKESEGSNRSSTSSWSEEPNTTNMDISTGHMVLAYMEDHLKNKQRLEQEWVGLCGYEAEPCATTIAYKAENKKKNRYPDKLPYDHNRVILNAMVNASNSDYINASSVTDHDPRNPSYVVTQAPVANTVADFWQMIWEQGCVVVVMLTKLSDNGHQLCHRYWPEEGSEQYHIFEVHLVSEHVWCDDYLVRSVYLKNTRTGETRTVTQFHFLSWPPNGIPSSTKALLEFRRKVNKSYRGRSCPIAVHCSDGVGRSGTYVLIDMVLNRMAKGCKEIDIAATLEHIRDQRGGMVQNRQQFEFCLMAVAEEVHAILKALPQ